MFYLVAADDLIDKGAAVIPAQAVQDRIGDRSGKACIECDFYSLLLKSGKDFFGMWEGGQGFIIAIEFDHFVDKSCMDTVYELVVIFLSRREFFEQERDSV